MKLTVLGSSSAGNCYLLESEKDTLIVEAGVNLKEIKKTVEKWPTIAGCLISHEHGDHASKAIGLMRLGVDVYGSPGTFKALKIVKNVHRAKKMQEHIRYNIGSFSVYPFSIEHDALQPFGFQIDHPESGKIIFITDTHYVKYKFPVINNLLIECNYSMEIMDRNMEKGYLSTIVRDKILKKHMSLDTCKQFLSANDLSNVQNIVLIHLSNGNSNANQFKREIQELTGKNVFIASKGLNIDFNKEPF